VHGANDTNVPVSESEQIISALRQAGRDVRYLRFSDDGHGIVKRENRAALAAAISEWLTRAFSTTAPLLRTISADQRHRRRCIDPVAYL
jgi:dipeptidyl aminopeptidase/acylaminoacyl peptidase